MHRHAIQEIPCALFQRLQRLWPRFGKARSLARGWRAGLVSGLGAAAADTVFCTVAGVTTLYSVDGKTFGPAPLKKTVTVTENGRSVLKEVEVKPSEYTTVRWTVPELGVDQTLKLGYRIQVK